jgi:tRNA(Ile)-lysidine synthase
MASSRKSKSDDLPGRVAGALAPVVPAGSSILLGLSGGIDSVVLLRLLSALAPRHSWRLSALHVHHGISPRADEWAVFCRELCASYTVPLHIEHVDITPLRDMGVEAAARELRHAALAHQPVDFIALAHHRDDQAETLLLQLLRGAGVRGVSAMAPVQPRPGMPTLLRPLLDVARAELLDYTARHELQWVDDESNADDRYPRNFLRHRVLPVLERRFPAYRDTLARSARHFAEASELLDQLALQDAAGAIDGGGLEVARLQSLDVVRGRNLLRFFIAQQGGPLPESARLSEMLRQLCEARSDAALHVAFGGWRIGRFQGRAYVFPVLPKPAADFCVAWGGEAELALPELGGTLHLVRATGQGASLEKLRQGKLTIHLRRGAERLRPDPKRPARSLKNLLQEHGVPPWRRDSLPLLYCGEVLVAVPEIGVDCAFQAVPGEVGVVAEWARKHVGAC